MGNNIGNAVEDVVDKVNPLDGIKFIFDIIKEAKEFIVAIVEFIKDLFSLIPKVIEIMQLVVKMIEMGIDFTEDMAYIMPPFIILYLTSYIIKQYEYIDDLSNII